MTKALLISVDGSVKRILVNGLKDLQAHVGGYIEGIYLNGGGNLAYVNEEGKLRGLPVNKRASMFIHDKGARVQTHDFIVGNMVIVGAPDENGEDTDVSEALCAELGL